MPLAQQDRMTARSSAHPAMFGSQSEIQRPPWPCCFHSRLQPRIGEPYSPIAVMTLAKLSGIGLPASLFTIGLGSNKSIWLGPPSMKRKMTLFALAGKRAGRGDNGESAGAPSAEAPP